MLIARSLKFSTWRRCASPTSWLLRCVTSRNQTRFFLRRQPRGLLYYSVSTFQARRTPSPIITRFRVICNILPLNDMYFLNERVILYSVGWNVNAGATRRSRGARAAFPFRLFVIAKPRSTLLFVKCWKFSLIRGIESVSYSRRFVISVLDERKEENSSVHPWYWIRRIGETWNIREDVTFAQTRRLHILVTCIVLLDRGHCESATWK